MEEPNDKRVQKVIIFSIFMAGALASVFALYRIALPCVENHNDLNIAVIAAIIFIFISYVMAVKGGIPPSPPKTTDNLVKDGDFPSPPKTTTKAGKHGIPRNQPQAAVKGGIDPPQRKTNG